MAGDLGAVRPCVANKAFGYVWTRDQDPTPLILFVRTFNLVENFISPTVGQPIS